MSSAPASDQPRLRLPRWIATEILAAARRQAPREACGLLVGRALDGVTEVERHAAAGNVHERPEDRFRLAPEDFLAAERKARAAGLSVVGFWHSHPAAAAEPSAVDRAESWEGYSYLIVSLADGGRPRLRSWRKRGERMVEEEIDAPPPRVEGMRP